MNKVEDNDEFAKLAKIQAEKKRKDIEERENRKKNSGIPESDISSESDSADVSHASPSKLKQVGTS